MLYPRLNLSPQAQRTLHELALIFRKPMPPQRRALGLDMLAELEEPAAIPELLVYTMGYDADITSAARKSVYRALVLTPLPVLPTLSERLRKRCSFSRYASRPEVWYLDDPGALKDFDVLDQGPGFALMALASLHGSGYVRDAALVHLGRLTDGKELPYLLLRLNDWVPAIRQKALALVNARFTDAYASAFVQCLPLRPRLEAGRRANHAPILEQIQELIRREENFAEVEKGLLSGNRLIAREVFRMAHTQGGQHQERMFELALRSSDPIVRLRAILAQPTNVTSPHILELMNRAMRDPFMPVRNAALRFRAESLGPMSDKELEASFLDPHISVRETARFYHRGDREVHAAFYRAALLRAQGRALAAAIGGLTETGDQADARALIPFLEHPQAKVARAAVRGCAALDLDGTLSLLVSALASPSRKVSRGASQSLSKAVGRLDIDALWGALVHSEYIHVRQSILSLLVRLSKWRCLPYLIRAVGDPSEEISDLALSWVRQWPARFNVDYSSPRPGDPERIRKELNQMQQRIPAPVRDNILRMIGD